MGYHAIDVISNFFGTPDIVSSLVSYKYRETQQENLEDYAEISMEFASSELKGSLVLDRHAGEKKEMFTIYGADGCMSITPNGYQIFDLTGKLVRKVTCLVSKEEEMVAMFQQAIPYNRHAEALQHAFLRNINNVKLIEKIYSCKRLKLNAIKECVSTYLEHIGIFAKNQLIDKSVDIIAAYCDDDLVKPNVTDAFKK
jgi:predicted dehydrogenase